MCNNPSAPMPSSPHQSESWFPNSHPAQSRSTLTETPLTNSTPFTMNPSSLTALPNTKPLGRAGSAQTQRSLEDFDRMIAINVRPVFVGAQAAGRHMNDGGRIIVIGSVTADRTGFPGASVYSMTKAAVAVLARGLAVDFAPRGITVNTIQPGPTETDMVPADGPHSDVVKSLVPLKRLGHADEIAAMVAFVASPEASFVTGAALNVDGGYLA